MRGEDVKERMEKQIWHDKIMNKGDIDSWNLSRELYNRVLKRIKEKGKKMFDLLNKSGESYKEAIYLYMCKIINSENIPFEFSATSLIPIWKKKGSALDLNMMRYIHMKSWEAKLCEALVTEEMKPDIIEACPPIQIGGMPKSSCSEHLLTLKTWMMSKEKKRENGIFQVFDMEKVFR